MEPFKHHRGGRCAECNKRIELGGAAYARADHVFCSLACAEGYDVDPAGPPRHFSR